MATDLENGMPEKDPRYVGDQSLTVPPPPPPPPPQPQPLPQPIAFSMIIGKEYASQWTSWLVPLIVIVNVVVFVVVMYVNNFPKHVLHGYHCAAKFLGRFSFEPRHINFEYGPSSSTLLKLGSLEWSRIVEEHEAWRLLTSMFLHGSVVHVVTNMLGLLFIGVHLEQQFGFVNIGIIYLVSGVGGSILSSLFIRNAVSVGASGSINGLLGCMLSELLINWTIYSKKVAALLYLVFVIVTNLAIGIVPHVDNFVHLGGFLSGFLLGFVLLPRPQLKWLAREHIPQGRSLRYKYKPYQHLLWLLSLALLITWFVVSLLLLFREKDGNDYCHWCRYLRCIPISRSCVGA